MANPRIFVTSDTHFGHRRILEFEKENRPYKTIEEHDRDLIARWNSVVNPNDTVWHLGDVFFGKEGHLVLGELNGYKKLILGNHDHFPLEVYQKYFSKIYGCFVLGKVLLSHVPVHPGQLEFRFRRNLHGHMHSKKIDDDRYVNCSMEHWNLTPVLLAKVMQ